MNKNPLWKQSTPRDQMIALLNSVQGTLLDSEFDDKTAPIFDQLLQLSKWMKPDWGITDDDWAKKFGM